MKWYLFFDFVCFNGRHILKLQYLSRGEGKYLFFGFSQPVYGKDQFPHKISNGYRRNTFFMFQGRCATSYIKGHNLSLSCGQKILTCLNLNSSHLYCRESQECLELPKLLNAKDGDEKCIKVCISFSFCVLLIFLHCHGIFNERPLYVRKKLITWS